MVERQGVPKVVVRRMRRDRRMDEWTPMSLLLSARVIPGKHDQHMLDDNGATG